MCENAFVILNFIPVSHGHKPLSLSREHSAGAEILTAFKKPHYSFPFSYHSFLPPPLKSRSQTRLYNLQGKVIPYIMVKWTRTPVSSPDSVRVCPLRVHAGGP